MGYQPIYEGEFDLIVPPDDAEELIDFLESVTSTKLMLMSWVTEGPAGGNPCVTLRGTRRQFITWFNGYYDKDCTDFQRDLKSDINTWENALDAYDIKFVA
jgi:hypothetical protein